MQIRKFVAQMPVIHKVLLSVSFLVLLLILFLFPFRFLTTGYLPLSSTLTANQMVLVIEQLNKDNIDYRISDQNIVLVERSMLLQVRQSIEKVGIINEDAFTDFSDMLSNENAVFKWMTLLFVLFASVFVFTLLERILYTYQQNKLQQEDLSEHEILHDTLKQEHEQTTDKPFANEDYETLLTHLEKRVELHSDDIAALIETMIASGNENSISRKTQLIQDLKYEQLETIDKIAFCLGQFHKENTAALFKMMDKQSIARISKVIARGIKLEKKIARTVLEEFSQLIQFNPYIKSGGMAYIEKVITDAMSVNDAQKMIETLTIIERQDECFNYLSSLKPQLLAVHIQKEHPQTIAFILAHLNASSAASVLESYPQHLRDDVVMRMATLGLVTLEVVEQMSKILESTLQLSHLHIKVGGEETVQEVIAALDTRTSNALLSHIAEFDSAMAKRIDVALFSFDKIRFFDKYDIRELLKKTDKIELIRALKGVSEELQEKILATMSLSIQTMVIQEMQHLKPITANEIDNAQMHITEHAKKLLQNGTIEIKRAS